MDIKKCATSDIKVAKSEKCPCANCRKPVSIMGHNQLKNGKGLCKECLSKTTPLFNCSQSTLDDYKISIRQLRDSEVLYFKYFKGNSSSRTILKTGIFGVTIEINSNVALMGVTVCASGFAALTKKYHLVFRVADFKRASKLSEKNHVLFNRRIMLQYL